MPDTPPKSSTSRPGSESDGNLLAAAKRAFEQTTLGDVSDGVPSPKPTVGRYRILSILGQGGMGIVYAAEQREPRRRVALKVIRGGCFVDERYIRLFQREIQTLARLKHPGIASIYESGRTDDGQHYFAMEMVEGVPLRDFVHRNELDLPQRLDLFGRLCAAMNYAHQRGVIHRDLKPTNILVEPSGNPKILDFGLARITDADVTCATVVSEPGRVLGTLAYMSPEQARGNPDDIDLRSDVYSLGVILYELLTDDLPYETGHSAMHEAIRAICDDEPRRPSKVNRALRGDLETIVLTALAKEPAARYQSAAALGEDLDRFAGHQPILARPPSTAYQLRKLVRRHRVGTAFVVSLIALLLGFSLWMSVLYRRAAYELTAAVSFKDFMLDVFRPADPNVARGEPVSAREILDRGAERIRREFAARPELQAEIMDAVAVAYRHLGEYEQAIALSEEALDIRRGQFGEGDEALAEGLLETGWSYKSEGNYVAAEKYVGRALEIHRRVLPADHPRLAKNLHLLGTTKRELGDPAAAAGLLREALAIRQRILEPEDLELGLNLADLAEVLRQLGKFDEAEDAARKAEMILEHQPGKTHPNLGSAKLYLAKILRAQGQYAEAVQRLHEARDIWIESYGEDHPRAATAAFWLGVVLRDLGEIDAAERNLRLALKAYVLDRGTDHKFVGHAKRELAWVASDRGDHAAAEKLFHDALQIYRDTSEPVHARIAEVHLGLARVALASGDPVRGIRDAEEAVRILEAGPAVTRWDTAMTQSVLGECLAAAGRLDEAEPLLLESHQELEGLRGAEDRYVREALLRVVNLYEAWGKPDKAAEYRATLTP